MSIVTIFEYSQGQVDRIESLGQEITEVEEVGDYELMLIKVKSDNHPMVQALGTPYEIGFQRKGRDFTQLDQLLGKEVFDGDNIDIRAFREVVSIIKRWTEQYGEIAIASMDDRKNKIYMRIFDRLDFRTEIKNVSNGMETMDFMIIS